MLEEIESERDSAQTKFDDIEAKYDAVEEPSEALQDRYDKAENDLDELQTLYDDITCYDLSDIIAVLQNYADVPDEYKTPKLSESPKIPNEFYVHVTKREYIRSSKTHVLHMEVWTDIKPFPSPYSVFWSDAEQSWVESEGGLPWLGGGDLYKQWMEYNQNLFSQLYNDKQDYTATFTRQG